MHRRSILATAALALGAGCTGLFGDDAEIDNFERGEIDVLVDGEPVDLSADRFQAEHAPNHSIDFHFHEFDEYWYMEGERVTFAEGLDLLPFFTFEEADGAVVLTADRTTYDEREPDVEIEFFVDDEPVDPTTHAVSDGEYLRVEIETGSD